MLTWRKRNLLHYETVLASLICFHLKSAVCQFHTVLVFFCHWRKGFICLTCLHHSPPLMKIKTGTHSSRNLESGTEAQDLGEHCLLVRSPWLVAFIVHNPEPPSQGWHCLQWLGFSTVTIYLENVTPVLIIG